MDKALKDELCSEHPVLGTSRLQKEMYQRICKACGIRDDALIDLIATLGHARDEVARWVKEGACPPQRYPIVLRYIAENAS